MSEENIIPKEEGDGKKGGRSPEGKRAKGEG